MYQYIFPRISTIVSTFIVFALVIFGVIYGQVVWQKFFGNSAPVIENVSEIAAPNTQEAPFSEAEKQDIIDALSKPAATTLPQEEREAIYKSLTNSQKASSSMSVEERNAIIKQLKP